MDWGEANRKVVFEGSGRSVAFCGERFRGWSSPEESIDGFENGNKSKL